MYKDSSLLNGIRNYVSISMAHQMFTATQLARFGNNTVDLNFLSNNDIKFIVCGQSKCGSDEKPILEFVKRR